MPREDLRPVSVADLLLPDARTGDPVDLGARGPRLLTAIRHRF